MLRRRLPLALAALAFGVHAEPLGADEVRARLAAAGSAARLDLSAVEPGLGLVLDEATALAALEADLSRIVDVARDAVRQAGLGASQVDALFLTGGSTGLRLLVQRLAACFPAARVVQGERFASVATGLGLHAKRVFG